MSSKKASSKKAKNENLKRVDTAAAVDGPFGLSLGELMGRPTPSPEPAKKPEWSRKKGVKIKNVKAFVLKWLKRVREERNTKSGP